MTGTWFQTLTCTSCGRDWERPQMPGRRPQFCLDCRPAIRASRVPKSKPRQRPVRELSILEQLAQDVTLYRLAILEALGELRVGRPAAALAVLERVPERPFRGNQARS